MTIPDLTATFTLAHVQVCDPHRKSGQFSCSSEVPATAMNAIENIEVRHIQRSVSETGLLASSAVHL